MNKIRTLISKLVSRKNYNLIKKIFLFFKSFWFHFIDILFIPITIPFAFLFKAMRNRKFANMPLSKRILFSIGVYPILDHFYEPMFNPKHLRKSLRENRVLSGIDLFIPEQIKMLNKFDYNEELSKLPTEKKNDLLEFCHNAGPFPPFDAEYFYNIIRHFKPRRIIEIGCGHSTLLAVNAVNKNKTEDAKYDCVHTCVEPFHSNWLEKLNVKVVRDLVEKMDLSFFESLNANDILFIDSTHIIRPQGDVLFEYLEILPILKSGVLIHIHDIFTPADYPDEWVKNAWLWNEQYLLEAFLTCNKDFEIIGADNFLKNNYYEQIAAKSPISKMLTESGKMAGAGSLWMVKK